MRVLFGGVPAAGHLFPLIPLAQALRQAGHEVVVVSLDGAESLVADLPFAGPAPGVDWRRTIRALGAARLPDEMARTVETNSADREAFVALAALVNDEVAESVAAFASSWRPDVVVYEYLFPAAAAAATLLGVPAVRHDLGFTEIAPLHAVMTKHMSVPMGEVLSLDVAPPSMVGGQSRGWPLRPGAYTGTGVVPPRTGPRIAVTLGTVPPKVGGFSTLDRVVTAAASVDAELVLVMGDMDISSLGGLPPNVTACGWVPWDSLVRTCDAVIHHGGSGTALAALASGVPQLVLPDGSDRFAAASAVHERGAGLSARGTDVSAELISRLLTDSSLRTASREVASEIAEMPSVESVARRLEILVS
ncbi:nucleotide disphospho-sugar-binding domain-containing protein [Lentzea sp. NPDC006480]|uniref:glycosyltransferase n=1 Tax=Lentzea sp. NPDC006480 TaxID=3157176 RepID=UPI0033B15092